MNIRYVGVQYMRNNPERFIESNTDHSWSRYLANMSQQGIWADALVIQAVADALNLTIHIVESNPGFASVSNNSPVNSENDSTVTVINIGHVDETHTVSTVPLFEETMVNNVIIHNNQPAQLTMDQCRTTNDDETIANMLTKEEKRKAYMKEYMTRRRRNNSSEISKIELCIEKDLKICKKQGNLKDAFNKFKELSPDHIREVNKQVFVKSEQNNPQHVPEVTKSAQKRKRSLRSTQVTMTCFSHLLKD